MTTLIKKKVVEALSNFCLNLKEDDLDLGFFSGEGSLHMLELNGPALHGLLNLPPFIILSKVVVTQVSATLSWTKIKSVPLKIFLKGVNVEIDFCNDITRLQKEQKVSEIESESKNKYGFTEKIVDGISVHIERINIRCKPSFNDKESVLPSLFIDINRLDIQSTNRHWRVAELPETVDVLPSGTEILLYKRIDLQTFSITIQHPNAKTENETFNLVINPLVLRMQSKKRLSDCTTVATHMKILIENLAYEITAQQINLAYNFFMTLGELHRSTIYIQAQIKEQLERQKKSRLVPSNTHMRRSSSQSSLRSVDGGMEGSQTAEVDFNDNVVQIEITDMLLRLFEDSDSCIALVQVAELSLEKNSNREYNYDNDSWITYLHNLPSEISNLIVEDTIKITCQHLMILPIGRTDKCHMDFMRLVNADHKVPRPSNVPLFTLHYADYHSDNKTVCVPPASVWIEAYPIEIVANPSHWLMVNKFFKVSMDANLFNYKVSMPSGMEPKGTEKKGSSMDIRITCISPTIVFPPLSGDTEMEGYLSMQLGRLSIDNQNNQVGERTKFFPLVSKYLFKDEFNDSVFSDFKNRRRTSKLYQDTLYFPHQRKDICLSKTMDDLLNAKDFSQLVYKLEIDSLWIDWIDVKNEKNKFNIIKPFDLSLWLLNGELFSSGVTSATRDTNDDNGSTDLRDNDTLKKTGNHMNIITIAKKSTLEVFLCPIHARTLLALQESYLEAMNDEGKKGEEDEEEVEIEPLPTEITIENHKYDDSSSMLFLSCLDKVTFALLPSSFCQKDDNGETTYDYNYNNMFDVKEHLTAELNDFQLSFENINGSIVTKLIADEVVIEDDSGIEKVVDEEHRNTQLLANQPNLSVRIQMLKNENTLLDNNEAGYKDTDSLKENHKLSVSDKTREMSYSVDSLLSVDARPSSRSSTLENNQIQAVLVNVNASVLSHQINHLTSYKDEIFVTMQQERERRIQEKEENKRKEEALIREAKEKEEKRKREAEEVEEAERKSKEEAKEEKDKEDLQEIEEADGISVVVDNSDKEIKETTLDNEAEEQERTTTTTTTTASTPSSLSTAEQEGSKNLDNSLEGKEESEDVQEKSKAVESKQKPNGFQISLTISDSVVNIKADSKGKDSIESDGTKLALEGLKVWNSADDPNKWHVGRLPNAPNKRLSMMQQNEATTAKAKFNEYFEATVEKLQQLLEIEKQETIQEKKEKEKYRKELQKRLNGSASARDIQHIDDLRKKNKILEKRMKSFMMEVQELKDINANMEREVNIKSKEEARLRSTLSRKNETIAHMEEEQEMAVKNKRQIDAQIGRLVAEKENQIKKLNEKLAFYIEAMGK